MNRKSFLSTAAALSAAFFSLACAAPAYAQKAALTRDVDRPTAQPVNGACNTVGTQTSLAHTTAKCSLYTVPSGKRLAVETISYIGVTASGTVMYAAVFGADPGSATLPFGFPNTFVVTPAFLYTDQGGTRVYGGTQALKIYLDESQILFGGLDHSGAADYSQGFTFSGYLVDK